MICPHCKESGTLKEHKEVGFIRLACYKCGFYDYEFINEFSLEQVLDTQYVCIDCGTSFLGVKRRQINSARCPECQEIDLKRKKDRQKEYYFENKEKLSAYQKIYRKVI